MSARLNLAARPFRNQRLPNFLMLAAVAILVAASAKHALVAGQLLPGQPSEARRLVGELEAERARLRSERRGLTTPEPDQGSISRWALLKDLIDRRALSWTGLLSLLEEVLPPEVRLTAIAPEATGGEFGLDVSGAARSKEAALGFFALLEARPEFAEVYPTSLGEAEGGVAFQCSMRYRPNQAPPASQSGAEAEASETGPQSEEPSGRQLAVPGRGAGGVR